MKHKFSRVQVKVDASSIDAQVTNVSGVVIAGGKKADLTIRTGGLAASSASGSDVMAAMTNWASVDGGKARQSDCVVFYPSLTTITLAAVDLEIEGVPLPLTNKSVTFSQTLAENTSYTVVVDVRANRWAWSNIYWVATSATEGYMTFDRTLVDVEHQYYAGIYFKWGSLVGFSRWGNSHLYIPNVGTETWDGPKAASATSWSDDRYVPYNTDNVNTGASYLYLHNNFAAYTGDICNYIDDEWRMPNTAEIGIATDYSSWIAGSVVSGYADGTGIITSGVRYNGSSGFAFFSASGYLEAHTNALFTFRDEGNMGYYYTGSPAGYVSSWLACYYLGLRYYQGQRYIYTSESAARPGGFTVRCIKKLPTD
jgi:hypothetical protein